MVPQGGSILSQPRDVELLCVERPVEGPVRRWTMALILEKYSGGRSDFSFPFNILSNLNSSF